MTLDPDRDDVTVSKHYKVCCTHPIESAKLKLLLKKENYCLQKCMLSGTLHLYPHHTRNPNTPAIHSFTALNILTPEPYHTCRTTITIVGMNYKGCSWQVCSGVCLC